MSNSCQQQQQRETVARAVLVSLELGNNTTCAIGCDDEKDVDILSIVVNEKS